MRDMCTFISHSSACLLLISKNIPFTRARETTETQEGGGELCFSCDPRVSVLGDNVSDS